MSTSEPLTASAQTLRTSQANIALLGSLARLPQRRRKPTKRPPNAPHQPWVYTEGTVIPCLRGADLTAHPHATSVAPPLRSRPQSCNPPSPTAQAGLTTACLLIDHHHTFDPHGRLRRLAHDARHQQWPIPRLRDRPARSRPRQVHATLRVRHHFRLPGRRAHLRRHPGLAAHVPALTAAARVPPFRSHASR